MDSFKDNIIRKIMYKIKSKCTQSECDKKNTRFFLWGVLSFFLAKEKSTRIWSSKQILSAKKLLWKWETICDGILNSKELPIQIQETWSHHLKCRNGNAFVTKSFQQTVGWKKSWKLNVKYQWLIKYAFGCSIDHN